MDHQHPVHSFQLQSGFDDGFFASLTMIFLGPRITKPGRVLKLTTCTEPLANSIFSGSKMLALYVFFSGLEMGNR